jgi:sulfur relay (sulfurtransferase) complex TusBCD TusD component (DsrE family)
MIPTICELSDLPIEMCACTRHRRGVTPEEEQEIEENKFIANLERMIMDNIKRDSYHE